MNSFVSISPIAHAELGGWREKGGEGGGFVLAVASSSVGTYTTKRIFNGAVLLCCCAAVLLCCCRREKCGEKPDDDECVMNRIIKNIINDGNLFDRAGQSTAPIEKRRPLPDSAHSAHCERWPLLSILSDLHFSLCT